MKRFVIHFKVGIPIPYSFFNFKYIKMIYVWKYSREDKEVEEMEIFEEEDKDEDFLGIETGLVLRYNGEKVTNTYFEKIRQKFSMKEIVRRYRHWLNNVPLPGRVSEMDYSTPYDFINVFINQFGVYWEVMLKFKRENPEKKVFIRNDGLGAMSMMCIALGIEYRSVEVYGIGEVAYRLGIIKSRDLFYEKEEGEVEILANLSNYIDISKYTKEEYIVIDENRLYDGIELKDVMRTSKMRVVTNVLKDNFINAGKDISKAKPMLKKQKNIPIDAKAEAFLLMSDLEVYTDGVVETKTKAKKVSSEDKKCYIMTTEKNIKSSNDLSNYYLNIVNRNVPTNWRVGKFGETKLYRDSTFIFAGDEVKLSTEYSFSTLKLSRYKDPHELKEWQKDGYFIIGNNENPAGKYYYVDRGVKKSVIFLNSIYDKQGKKIDVYQPKDDVNIVTRQPIGYT